MNLFAVNSLDHGDASTEDRHAVALLQGSFVSALVVILLTPLDKVAQSCVVVSRTDSPERDVLLQISNANVNAESSEHLQSGLDFGERERQRVRRQGEVLG